MRKALLSLALLLLAPFALAQDFSIIDDYVKENKRLNKLPSGTAIAIVKDDKIIYEGYFGYADIENKKKVDENTVFYIASMTKPIYSLLTLMLEEQGKLNTDWSLNKLYPSTEFVAGIEQEQVTIKHLLSHTSGIDNWSLIQTTAYTGDYDKATISKIIAQSNVNEKAPFGQYKYTNVGYNILSHWMDDYFKTPWQSLLDQEVFSPLGMKHTSARMSDIGKYNWQYAKGYSVRSPNSNEALYLQKNDQTMHAAGGLISTATDLAKLLIVQNNQGKLNNKQVVPADVIEKSHQVLVTYNTRGNERSYGWGWSIRNLFDQDLYEHRGGYAGASTYMSFMPDKNLGLIVLSNQDSWGGDLAYTVEDLAYSILLGQSDEDTAKLMANNKRLADKKRKNHFDLIPTDVQPKPAKIVDVHLGEYHHELLGTITLSQQNDSSFAVHWGNVNSTLYDGEDNKLQVMFFPNRLQNIALVKPKLANAYIEFNGFKFY